MQLHFEVFLLEPKMPVSMCTCLPGSKMKLVNSALRCSATYKNCHHVLQTTVYEWAHRGGLIMQAYTRTSHADPNEIAWQHVRKILWH
jgi:hypothetical protein